MYICVSIIGILLHILHNWQYTERINQLHILMIIIRVPLYTSILASTSATSLALGPFPFGFGLFTFFGSGLGVFTTISLCSASIVLFSFSLALAPPAFPFPGLLTAFLTYIMEKSKGYPHFTLSPTLIIQARLLTFCT